MVGPAKFVFGCVSTGYVLACSTLESVVKRKRASYNRTAPISEAAWAGTLPQVQKRGREL